MKKFNLLFQFSSLTSLLVAGFFTFAMAQNADSKNDKQKLTIDIEVTENGKVTKISKEVDAAAGESIHDILRELNVMDDLDIRGTGERLEIKVKKETSGRNDKNMDVQVFSPDCDNFKYEYKTHCEPKAMLGVFISPYDSRGEKGALVSGIVPGSAAEKAELKEADIIIKVNETVIDSDQALKKTIDRFKVGDEVTITYLREGKRATKKVTLGVSSQQVSKESSFTPNGSNQFFFEGALDHEKLNEYFKNGQFNYEFERDENGAFLGVTPMDESADVSGVRLGEVISGSAAEKMGLKAGDRIMKIDGQKVNRFSHLAEAISAKKSGEAVTVEYERDEILKTTKGELGKRADAPKGNRVIRMELDKNAPYDKQHPITTKEVRVMIELKDCSKEEEAVLAAPAKVDFSKDLGISTIEFSPNPNNGQFQLNFKLTDQADTRIMVLDQMGRRVHEELLSNFDGQYSNRIDIGSQPNGVYFLIIAQGDKQFTRKIVKQ